MSELTEKLSLRILEQAETITEQAAEIAEYKARADVDYNDLEDALVKNEDQAAENFKLDNALRGAIEIGLRQTAEIEQLRQDLAYWTAEDVKCG